MNILHTAFTDQTPEYWRRKRTEKDDLLIVKVLLPHDMEVRVLHYHKNTHVTHMDSEEEDS